MKSLRAWGIKQNNLKNIDVSIPLGSLTVICGPSGSGKSSLAFETLYAEGQRRYIESLSSYSRQFLNKAPKPDLEGIENIPPAISIEQKNAVKSSRSTVGTSTEIVDHLRLLFEKIGKAQCPTHHLPLHADSSSTAAARLLKLFPSERGYLLAPVFAAKRLLTGKGSESKLLQALKEDGFRRIYVPVKGAKLKWEDGQFFATVPMGEVVDIDDAKAFKAKVLKEDFYIVIDRLVLTEAEASRVASSMAQAFAASQKFSKQAVAEATFLTVDGKQIQFGEDTRCSICDFKMPPISSALFSFNSPVGACPDCNGFGNKLDLDRDKVIPNPELSLNAGAIAPFAMPSAAQDRKHLRAFAKKMRIDLDRPWSALSAQNRQMIWDGNEDFYGVRGLFEYLETKKYKMHVRVFISRFKSPFTCPSCKGSRLKPEALLVRLRGQSIAEFTQMTIKELRQLIETLHLTTYEAETCAEPMRQLRERLKYLDEVGVGYLTVDRPTRTLSGGEFQRLQLANQLGMGLSRTLYVLDEPTVGLHPRDTDRLIGVMKRLQEAGNTLVVVEHDPDVIEHASHVVEMGPGSGHLGGEVLFHGEAKDFIKSGSLTATHLHKKTDTANGQKLRPVSMDDHKYSLEFTGCNGHNLKNINVAIPLNRLVTVTGVSGSGKSTLVTKTIYPAVARHLGIEFTPGLPYEHAKGLKQIKNVVLIDQSGIGKTARSNPLTYLKIFDTIRSIFAATSDAKSLGYAAGTFSLNVDGGRCPVCKGLGFELVDMMFMDDIEIKCDACDGQRFRKEVLDVRYKGLNIAEVLKLTVAEAMDFFVNFPAIRKPLSVLKDVGLDYLQLGQSANTLSGGESQRMKLVRELSQSGSGKQTLYILDEPTTGLHFREVHLLLNVLNRLIEAGSSVLLVEHNLEIIKNSDYVIDLGPEAGSAGGQILAQGSPADLIAQAEKSLTGFYLRKSKESEI